MYIDINTISLYLDLNIFQQDECFCFKFGMEIEYAKYKLKESLSQIWVICLFKIIMPLQFSDLPHFVEEKLQHAYNTEHLEIYIVLPYLFTKLQYRCLTFHTITFHIVRPICFFRPTYIWEQGKFTDCYSGGILSVNDPHTCVDFIIVPKMKILTGKMERSK